jgi:3-oxoacyl-[acyl-carrier protein] reductase
MKKLEGKIAVVTEASKGIGAAIAKHLATKGAAVVVNYASSKERAEACATTLSFAWLIKLLARAVRRSQYRQMFPKRQKSNVFLPRRSTYSADSTSWSTMPEFMNICRLKSSPEEHFHKHFDLNVLGLILTSQQAAKYFGSAGGSIINISSIASTTKPATASVYRVHVATAYAISYLEEIDVSLLIKNHI